MVKFEDRPMFGNFVKLMYKVDVSNCAELQLTQNVSHFANLFKHIAAEISGPPSVDADTQNIEAPDFYTWGDEAKPQESLTETLPNLPSPKLRCDFVPYWNLDKPETFPILTVMVAATVIFGLILAFFLGQSHLLLPIPRPLN